MRSELFHMERDVLNVGDEVEITESQLPYTWYYTVVPALAMSTNYGSRDRIRSRKGVVTSKVRRGSTYELMIDFEN